ncbi:MAG TPA: FAD-dependent oxidoreductase [Ramlibacter sp.]|nr:FAD-dependent oxidoreductase [Ramlibacter sp.]
MPLLIIGAGLAGLSAAQALLARGVRDITVLEAGEGAGRGTSFANGALLHPSLAEPWNAPGVGWSLLRDLGNEQAAALVRLKAVPGLLGWGARFLRESAPERYLRNTLANLALAWYSVPLMAELRAAGVQYRWQPSGSLVLFRGSEALRRAREWSAQLEAKGLRREWLTPAEAIAREPLLAPLQGQLAGAQFNPEDERGDAQAYCDSLAALLQREGVQLRYRTAVISIEAGNGRVAAVRTATGERIACEQMVVAAASHSTPLLRGLGLRLPVQPVKGYSVTFERAPVGEAVLPRTPVIDPDLHVAVVPVGDDRLRVAGTAEFCGFDSRIAPARVANLVGLASRLYPQVADEAAFSRRPWIGLRPMCADGVALVGRTRVGGLWLNTGHGHLGWTQAAGSGHLLADLLLGRQPALDPSPYAPERFGL